MKKLCLFIAVLIMALLLVGCGAKKCFTCGKTLDDESYSAFGNNYCSYCFMYDLGLDKENSDSEKTSETESKEETITPTSPTIHMHKYTNATCTQPQKCSCGSTVGTALGHKYSEATCTSPQKCERCENETGSILEHNWQAATYASPKKCKNCGKTVGSKLQKVLKNITVASLPIKTVYNVGENFDSTGLKIKLNYSNGSYETKSSGFEIKGFSSASAGNNTIKIEYKEFTTSFTVKIVIEDVKLINLTPIDKYEFTKGVDVYDCFGNYYDRCLLFSSYKHPIYGHHSRATYSLYGNYSRFYGKFIVSKPDFESTGYGNFTVNIYADDELIYTKQNITLNTRPLIVDIDIKKCNALKIKVTNTSTAGEFLILSDAKFIK